MLNRILFVLVILLIPVSFYPQSTSKNQIEKYIAQSKDFLTKREKDSAFLYVNKALLLSEKQKDIDQKVAALDQKGKIYLAYRQYNEALPLFEKAISLPSSKKTCEIYNSLGIAKFNLGKGYESIKIFLLAEECYKNNKTKEKVNSTLLVLGYSYMYVGEYKKASYYFHKQLNEIKKESSQAINISTVYNALGNNSNLQGNYKEAVKYLHEGLKFANSTHKDDVLISLANNYILMKDYEMALKYSSEALQRSEKNNNESVVLESKIYNTTAFIGLKNFDEASLILSEVEKDTLKSYFAPTLKIQFYTNKAMIYEGLGQYREALKSQKRLKKYSDSIVDADNNVSVSDLKEQYEIEKNSNVILTQKSTLAQQSNQLKRRTILILVISFLMIILVAIIGFSLYKRKQENTRKRLLSLEFQQGFNEYLKNKYLLTDLQLELWLKIIQGMEESQIAASFFKSGETINRWRRQLYAKLNSVEKTEKNYTKSKAIILFNTERTLFIELSQ